jgi:hypothetical protein
VPVQIRTIAHSLINIDSDNDTDVSEKTVTVSRPRRLSIWQLANAKEMDE